MACHEVRCGNLICRADGLVAETEVRASETTRLLRVVREVSLAILVGVVTDNLHGVFVSTYSTISTQAVELSFEDTLTAESYFFFGRKRSESDIVNNAQSELILRFGQSKIFKYGKDLSRSGILRTQTITSTYNQRSIFLAI